MSNPEKQSDYNSHPGGDTEFWQDDWVKQYDRRQALVVEKKQEVLNSMVRIVAYFCQKRAIKNPTILDVGCGPGTLSAPLLDKLPNSTVVGVDASEQMVEAARRNLVPEYETRFSGYVCDFNSDDFWISSIEKEYDFIVSSIALHYLSDTRRQRFFVEIFNHLDGQGIFVACIGNRSGVSEIAEMEHSFRAEFLWNNLDQTKRPESFEDFKKDFIEEKETKANINWQSPEEYLDCMRNAGFKMVDIVWHLWVKSIYVAIK